ncbi:membrane-associated proteins in eicosanoid and glutathione metabolism [Aaosphaeria arxii CBS 175.79]|uniref:Membrane-associated proteins in eicosanoid and glutathione metabolism n=1 Tax=Aaosphaeria arxii CBS 175.79 TaxID=1450172 RepID=A0A6A5XQ47_9PLEO|nr:membrane-associated proteins in eicosanoid and glutathione metabolism [Aaosphaeria arxii CBS 175.79]KAF2015282.1 membrane-associated proteins in eicosanoid and glutathione metabolism [Aaosphaeria arxii CBS 175.79]
MVSVEIPAEYGYVLASAVSTFFVGAWLGGRVSSYRKAAQIPYPYEYASFEQVQSAPTPEKRTLLHQFNCAQRGHQNFNENHPTAVAAMLITGLQYPLAAAGLGATWSVGRVLYGLGYTNGKEGGKGRYNGAAGLLAHYVLLIMSAKTAWDFVRA